MKGWCWTQGLVAFSAVLSSMLDALRPALTQNGVVLDFLRHVVLGIMFLRVNTRSDLWVAFLRSVLGVQLGRLRVDTPAHTA